MPAYFNTGAGYKFQAWHGDMIVFDDDPNVSEAMCRAEMDYEYELTEVYTDYPMLDGTTIRVPMNSSRALMRGPIPSDPEPRFIAYKGNRYKPLQNMMIGRILDPLTTDWHVDTVGVIKDWSITWASLLMEPVDIGGYEQEQTITRLLVSDDKSGPGAAYWGTGLERVVCANTYARFMNSAKELYRIPHTGDPELELNFRRDLAIHAIQSRKHEINNLNAMIITPLADTLTAMLEAAFPYETAPRELALVKMIPDTMDTTDTDAVATMVAKAKSKEEWLTTRNEFADKCRAEAAQNLLRFNDEHSYAANTLYAAFQAITQQVNHSDLYRGDEAQRLASVLWGDRSKSMNAALNVAVKAL